MKASELIKELQSLIEQHGDLDVLTTAGQIDAYVFAELEYNEGGKKEYDYFYDFSPVAEEKERLLRDGFIEIG